MKSEFEADINSKYYEPVTAPEKEFPPLPPLKKKNKPLPKEEGYPYPQRTTHGFWGGFILAIILLSFVVIAGFLVFYVGEGMFKDEINQEVNLEQNITVNSNVENTFQNTFQNRFQLNATIIIREINIFTNGT